MTELKPSPFCGGTKLKIGRKSRLAGRNGLDMRVEMHTYSPPLWRLFNSFSRKELPKKPWKMW